MSAVTFDRLLGLVAPRIHHAASHRAPVSNAESLAVTLRFLAAGISQQALAASYKLGNATVSNIIKEVCQALWAGLKEEVQFPQVAQWGAISDEFWTKWDYPNCIGAIDGKHVRVNQYLFQL